MAVHNDPYGLQPVKVDEPTPGLQVWAKPMAISGRRAIAILNRTASSAQVKLDWEKLGLDGTPKSVRDVWNARDLATADTPLSVPAEDLALLVIDGQDKSPAEYPSTGSDIKRIRSTSSPTFARLEYVNTSGQVAVVRVKSTSGFSTAVALPPTAASSVGTVALILPHGTADVSFEAQTTSIRKLLVYSWKSVVPE